MASFRCYDNSDVIATLVMTNFHLNTTVVAIVIQMLVYGDVVYAQTWYWPWKTVSGRLHMPGRPMLLQYGPRFSFRLFRKNLGNLRDVFGQMVFRPPWQKISRTPMVEFQLVTAPRPQLLVFQTPLLNSTCQVHILHKTLRFNDLRGRWGGVGGDEWSRR